MRNLVIGFAVLFGATLTLTLAGAAQQPEPPRKTAIANPVFTTAQAERGRQVYEANCTGCHLPGLDGSGNPNTRAVGTPLVGARFMQDFGEGRVSALFNKIQRDMPNGKAGSLSEQQYLDVAAFVLQQNKFPAGTAELTVDSGTEIWIPGAGGAEGLADYTYVSGVGCLQQDPSRSWMLTSAQQLQKAEISGPPPAASDAPGQYSFRLLNAYNHSAEKHDGQRMRVSGYLIRLGAEIRVNVQALQLIGPSCK